MGAQDKLKKFSYLIFLTVLSFQLNDCVVSCDDITILDKNTNQIVFQTASDFIRSSKCGSFFQKEGYFVVSDPLLICETVEDLDPIPPMSFLNKLYWTLKITVVDIIYFLTGVDLKEDFEDTPWVLVTQAEETGFCDLEKKLKSIAKAGYSSVLLATKNLTRKTLEFNLRLATKRKNYNFLDIHLINPWDIRVLSEYAYSSTSNGTFTILGPPREESRKCRDFYKESIFSKLVKELAQTKILFYTTATLILLSPLIYLSMYMSGFFAERSSYSYGEQFSHQRRHQYRESDSEPDHTEENNRDTRPPPPPPQQAELRWIILQKLQLLGLRLNSIKELTTARVTAAYRAKAMTEHPDKHNHLRNNPEEYQRQTEKFRDIKGAYDFLLKICLDAPPSEE